MGKIVFLRLSNEVEDKQKNNFSQKTNSPKTPWSTRMHTYQSPLKNTSAASLSLLLGLVVIAAIALSLRVSNNDQLSQQAEPVSETAPVDSSISETQRLIQSDREQKLGSRTPAEQKTLTETKPVTTTITVPAPQKATPAPAKKKSDRTTKTS